MPDIKFKPEDRLQKTWIPEGTEEYKTFKKITDENNFLAKTLKSKFNLGDDDLLLDVGGREGDISITLQKPEFIHLVDPDPTLELPFKPIKYWKDKIQNLDLSEYKYKLIICSHVLGYLGAQDVQSKVFSDLTKLLDKGGTLVLFYNTNNGYMGDLLEFSKNNLSKGHYDYFNEDLLKELNTSDFDIEKQEVSFQLDYQSYEELARCCWFLFGAIDQDIDGVAYKFLPKLKADLYKPSFPIEERITYISKK